MNSEQPFDFQRDVIEQSRTIPVLVDFWAEWCAPCRTLTPILEKFAEKSAGRWNLVKIDTETYPVLASKYKVKGIPNVKLFIDGEVHEEFSGALTEYQVEQWLKKCVPSPHAREVAMAADFLLQGEPSKALSLLEGVVQKEPDNLMARAKLAGLRLFAHPAEAVRLCEALEYEPEYTELVETLKTIARIIQLEPESMPDESEREEYLAAAAALRAEDFDRALASFIGVLQRNRPYDNDGSRKACIAIFRHLGEEHEIVRKYRRMFDRAF